MATRRRFAAESRAVARLAHPNVVGVYDVGEHRGSPYLIMELVAGGTLAELIAAGPLPEDVVRQVGLDILAGLGAAHAAGLLHRDVKPGNVLIAMDGTAKLADFGIAKSDPPSGDATATAAVIGTPSYLAPERAAGAPASVASDLWAVGVVLYEASTGVKPYQGVTPLAAALAARSGHFVPLRVRRPDADPALADAVHAALSPDPAARPPNAEAMADDIQDLTRQTPATEVAQTPVAMQRTSILPPTSTVILDRNMVPRDVDRGTTRRTLAGLVAASIVVVALVAALLTWALVDRHHPPAPPAPTTTVNGRVATTIPAPTTAQPTVHTPPATAQPTMHTPPATAPSTPSAPPGGGDRGNGHGNGKIGRGKH